MLATHRNSSGIVASDLRVFGIKGRFPTSLSAPFLSAQCQKHQLKRINLSAIPMEVHRRRDALVVKCLYCILIPTERVDHGIQRTCHPGCIRGEDSAISFRWRADRLYGSHSEKPKKAASDDGSMRSMSFQRLFAIV